MRSRADYLLCVVSVVAAMTRHRQLFHRNRTQSRPPLSRVQATIKDMEDAYVARDLDRFVSYFTDDIVAMPSGMPPVVGIEAWRNLLTELFAGSDVSNFVSKSEDITVVGDWAIEWHNEAATYTSKDSGEPNRVYHKGMCVFHKVDGRWKVARYVWNDNPEIEPNA